MEVVSITALVISVVALLIGIKSRLDFKKLKKGLVKRYKMITEILVNLSSKH